MRKSKQAFPKLSQLTLSSLMAFETAARRLNFSQAARELSLTPTAVTNSIKLLESQLDVRLFNRTTRSVSLTEAGLRLKESLLPSLEQMQISIREVSEASSRPTGLLKLNMSYAAYEVLIEPRLAEFRKTYPGIVLDIALENDLTDIVVGRFDAGIRLGRALQQDMISKRIGPSQQFVIVAAPQFFDTDSKLVSPADLMNFNCIRQRKGPNGDMLPWVFNVGGEPITLDVTGNIILSDMRYALHSAENEHGIAYLLRALADESIKHGQVKMYLEEYCHTEESYYIYYPNREFLPGKLQAFISHFN